jgi:hypothetical protein
MASIALHVINFPGFGQDVFRDTGYPLHLGGRNHRVLLELDDPAKRFPASLAVKAGFTLDQPGAFRLAHNINTIPKRDAAVDDGGLGIGLGIIPRGAGIALATGLDVEIAAIPFQWQ